MANVWFQFFKWLSTFQWWQMPESHASSCLIPQSVFAELETCLNYTSLGWKKTNKHQDLSKSNTIVISCTDYCLAEFQRLLFVLASNQSMVRATAHLCPRRSQRWGQRLDSAGSKWSLHEASSRTAHPAETPAHHHEAMTSSCRAHSVRLTKLRTPRKRC